MIKKEKTNSGTRNKLRLAVLFLTLIFAEVGLILALRGKEEKIKASAKLEDYADFAIETCKNVKYKPACYDEEIPKFMDTVSMEQAFEITKMIQSKDRDYAYCHVLGHKLSALETRKDPAEWKSVVAQCPSGLCSNGCIHGAFQERFRTDVLSPEEIEKLKPDLKEICEAREGFAPTGLEQASCYHALGHLTMYITGADIDKSINLCQEIGTKGDGRDFNQLCYDGAFMQIFQPLEPEDFALVEGKGTTKKDLPEFCGRFEGLARASCLTEGWPLYRSEIQTPKGLVEFCSNLENEYDNWRCYNAMFYVLTPLFNYDSGRIESFCKELPAEKIGQCFANAASRMIETDWRNIQASTDLCLKAEAYGVAKECYEELLLYSTYNFQVGSSEQKALCNKLPKQYADRCLAKDSD